MNKSIHKNGETAVRGRIGNENGSLQEKKRRKGEKIQRGEETRKTGWEKGENKSERGKIR